MANLFRSWFHRAPTAGRRKHKRSPLSISPGSGMKLALEALEDRRLLAVWSQQDQVVAFPTPQAAANYGHAVAVDAELMVVGAPSEGGLTGAVYIYRRNDNGTATASDDSWSAEARLTASDGAAGDRFGNSVSISGETVVVGSFLDDGATTGDSGSAYVFTRSGAVWSQQQKLSGNDAGSGDQFGISVSISEDTVAVGSYRNDGPGLSNSGSAYIFTRSGTSWTQQQKLSAGDAAPNDNFGYSVSISGETVVVGSIGDNGAGPAFSGSAYAFTRSGTLWSQQQKLTASDGASFDQFGISVSISGETVVVGSYLDAGASTSDSGSAYVFSRSGTLWNEQQKLSASDPATSDRFGWSVAISGETVVVGSYWDDGASTSDSGSAFVFTRSGTLWSEEQKLTASDAASRDQFGFSVSISGETVVVGSNVDDVISDVDAGSAYVFLREAPEAPVVNLYGSSGSETDEADQQFAWQVSDVDGDLASVHVDITHSGTSIFSSGDASGTFDFNALGPGNYGLTVIGTDLRGASATDARSVQVIDDDPAAPDTRFTGAGNQSDGENNRVGWDITDVSGFASVLVELIRVSDGAVLFSNSIDSQDQFDLNGLATGVYRIQSDVTDGDADWPGDALRSTASATFILADDDPQPPVIVLSGSRGTESDDKRQEFTWDVSDASGLADLRVTITQGSTVIHTSSQPRGTFNFDSFGLGTYTIDVIANDNDRDSPHDDMTQQTGHSVVVTDDDTDPPAIALGGSSGSESHALPQEFTWAVGDPSGSIQNITVSRDGVAIFSTNEANGRYNFDSKGVGFYQIVASATDNDNDWVGDPSMAATSSRGVTVVEPNTAPANLVVTAMPAMIEENHSTLISGSFTDTDVGDSHVVTVDWGDGSPVEEVEINLAPITFNFQGTVNLVFAGLQSVFSIGQTITGSYSFDPKALDSQTSDPFLGIYAIQGLNFTVDNGVYSGSAGTATGNSVFVFNAPSNEYGDEYSVVALNTTGPSVNDLVLDRFRLDLDKRLPPTAISADTLPLSVEALAGFGLVDQVLSIEFKDEIGNTHEVRATLDSLTQAPPEAATFSARHTYVSPRSFFPTVQVVDAAGASVSQAVEVNVFSVPPEITSVAISPSAPDEAEMVTLAATFADSGLLATPVIDFSELGHSGSGVGPSEMA